MPKRILDRLLGKRVKRRRGGREVQARGEGHREGVLFEELGCCFSCRGISSC